jgi:hypothetical protein
MNEKRLSYLFALIATACALGASRCAYATGVPISGFLPMAGISLTDEYEDEEDDPLLTFFQAEYESSLVGTQLGASGTPHYDVALIDTGAAATLITTAADTAFGIAGAGFRGTQPLPLGGATGGLVATTNDPMSIYASGLGPTNRVGTGPLTLNTSLMIGQSSVSLATLPTESDLPNVLGIPFTSQYAMYIRNDQPQIFTLDGATVRTPQVQFLPLGSGGQGIVRRVPIILDDPIAFITPPSYVYDFANIFADPPVPWSEDPLYPTLRIGGNGQPAAAHFVNVSVNNEGNSLTNTPFLLDTGADVSVVSEINAVHLGFDPVLDTPDFTVAVIGSGGLAEEVPGFYVDQLTIPAVGGSITLTNVPFIVLDFPHPAQVGNVAQGLLGMNALAGRNVVIDPNPATGQGGSSPSLYISDPVTISHNWAGTAASGTWSDSGNWSAVGTPDVMWIANVRNISGGSQEAVVSANSTVWELNVSGSSAATMTVRVGSSTTLTTFSGANIEAGGRLRLEGGTLDAQFVDVRGGTLTGTGSVLTGSGPIPAQVENHGGIVAPGGGIGTLNIAGRFANASDGTLEFELGGTMAGTQYDQIHITREASLGGTLSVSLADLGGGTFTPSPGSSFTLLTAAKGVGGRFDTLLLPAGFQWNVTYGANDVVLSVMGLGVAGDYNQNGVVDAADYIVWRGTMGDTGSGLAADGNGDMVVNQDDYALWRSNFGRSAAGASSAAIRATGVPEPASPLLVLVAACGLALSRKWRRCLTPPVRFAAWMSCGASCSS